jgi:hypothetical protein
MTGYTQETLRKSSSMKIVKLVLLTVLFSQGFFAVTLQHGSWSDLLDTQAGYGDNKPLSVELNDY